MERQTRYTGARLDLSSEEIADRAQHGITFGSHTATHFDPDPAESERTMRRVREGQSRSGRGAGEIRIVAYPFGEFDDVSRDLATQPGHSSVAKVSGVNRPLDIMSVARVPVLASSKASLFAELEVVAPMGASRLAP